MSIKIGMFLPCGSGVEPEPIFIEDYNSIQNRLIIYLLKVGTLFYILSFGVD
jgi:hypothetical protein